MQFALPMAWAESPSTMNPWDEKALSRRFRFAANSAESYMEECKNKVSRSERYKALHDEHLAKFYVYNYLPEKLFLSSPKAFLTAMRELLDKKVSPPAEAFDGTCFLQYHTRYIEGLIAQVTKAWPDIK